MAVYIRQAIGCDGRAMCLGAVALMGGEIIGAVVGLLGDSTHIRITRHLSHNRRRANDWLTRITLDNSLLPTTVFGRPQPTVQFHQHSTPIDWSS